MNGQVIVPPDFEEIYAEFKKEMAKPKSKNPND